MSTRTKINTRTTPIRFTEGQIDYWDDQVKQWKKVDTTTARLYFHDGRVTHYDDQALAYFVWLHLPKGIRVAFRGANDTTPVYPWDYVDAL